MRRRDLQRALENVPDFPSPKAEHEQYRTPAAIAAEWLFFAADDGALRGRRVLDLGCGTGMLAKGASLMGSGSVHGVDQDPDAVAIARAVVPDATFEVAEIAGWTAPSVDTVLMNPPFGAQRRHADRVFYERALDAAAGGGTIWFLQQPVNERFLEAYFRERGCDLERVHLWDYPLEARFGFHARGVAKVDVALYLATV